jgi:hypothetical protein
MTAVRTIEFTAPAPLLNANRPPTTVRARIARSRQIAAWRTIAHQVGLSVAAGPTARRLPPCFVHVELPVPDRRRRDPANYMTTVKPIVDGLVAADWWPDDTPDWVHEIVPRLRVTPRHYPLRVVVAVHPLADGFPIDAVGSQVETNGG